ncbi:hypothetical protein ACVIJW_009754 [Bradyrhizobium barranii subsp. barranii]
MVGQSLSKMRGLVLRRYSSKTQTPPSKDNMELVISMREIGLLSTAG